jgi:spore coat polysaccharide biosynthesis protein SpsF
MPMKVVSTIEARMGSTRFPGKVLERIGEATVLEWTAKRIRMARQINVVVVATTTSTSDDLIADVCGRIGLPCYRGSEEDVLNRVANAARTMNADVVVQAGADCPFYDPDIIDQMIGILVEGDYQYVCNDLEEGYPVGVNLHVIASETLYGVEQLATSQRDRENVVTYIWEHPEDYRIFNLTPPPELRRPDIRLTVDYREDLALLNELSKGTNNDSFRTIDIIRYLEENPGLLEINRNCKMKQSSCAYNAE